MIGGSQISAVNEYVLFMSSHFGYFRR